MSIRVALRHLTEYRYDRPVNLLPHVVRLRPAPHCRTPILAYSLKVEPRKHFVNWQQDPYGNYLARLAFPEPAKRLKVEVDLVAELTALNPFDFFVDEAAERFPFEYEPALTRELAPYRECGPGGPLLEELVAVLRRSGVRTIDFLVDLNREVHRRIRYIIRMESGVQACEETLARGSGSCRDSAWLLVEVLRRLGLAARFASGYLVQLKADLRPASGPTGPEADFSDLHAWTEVFLPGAGWIGLDPTSGLLAGEGHLPLACAADPVTAAPITGTFLFSRRPGEDPLAPCGEELDFQMSVARIHETPRSSRPYRDEEWRAIEALGERVDEELLAGDVRLTFGGEPTFIAATDRDAPEWNIAALGDEKLRKGEALLLRLRDRLAPGGLLHHGQGKWYPGESLPRWALSCYFRRDGAPIWREPLLSAEGIPPTGADVGLARRFILSLAGRLHVAEEHAVPGHEDAWYYLWRERRLPANVDPLHSNLEDPEERRRLAHVFEQGLDAEVGYALPLRRQVVAGGKEWRGGRWFLRRERMYLLPGDSPMGYRLPLDSLPWEEEGERISAIERDPLTARSWGPLPPPTAMGAPPLHQPRAPALASVNGRGGPGGQSKPDDAPAGLTRTALCVEPRHGRLFVFLPPLETAEDYIELVRQVEETAGELGCQVAIEGYPPPFDPRLNHLQITPDPGVLEVNIHPAHSWKELVGITTTLYREARATDLTTEKYLVDGRPAGTGGGSHVILGGPTPADSPFLRRPDLLRSLVAFWLNHPSLSYLFNGLFLGPTSQSPRIDEARGDSLYEIELAFRQLPEDLSRWTPPWLVDRLFRHLLIDASGNTHRTEFSIDKLYSPDGPGGRRGLVELRCFEMPPHERMALALGLLVRGLLAWFWKAPYRRQLVHFGADLHDRYLLPHFLEQDFQEVIEELRLAGYPFEEGWFAPHREFRFPLIGAIACRGIRLELRPALEPWLALGEESAQGGQVRYVDSSLERLQVKVQGLTDDRFVVACNGRRVPLAPTGTTGEFVAGVRFRAWQPPSCLHPTIPAHSPLVFDLIDGWRERAIGGCTYHVSHPGGRSFDAMPINSAEAEGRWRARFWPFGHTPGTVEPPPPEPLREFPLTLDLRQPAPSRGEAGRQ